MINNVKWLLSFSVSAAQMPEAKKALTIISPGESERERRCCWRDGGSRMEDFNNISAGRQPLL
jgi:hypothetical protein